MLIGLNELHVITPKFPVFLGTEASFDPKVLNDFFGLFFLVKPALFFIYYTKIAYRCSPYYLLSFYFLCRKLASVTLVCFGCHASLPYLSRHVTHRRQLYFPLLSLSFPQKKLIFFSFTSFCKTAFIDFRFALFSCRLLDGYVQCMCCKSGLTVPRFS